MKQVFKNSSYILLDRIASSGFVVINLFIMIGYYSAEQVGVYQYSVALGVIISLLMTFVDEKVVKSYFGLVEQEKVVKSAKTLKIYMLIVAYFLLAMIKTLGVVEDNVFYFLIIFLTAAGIKEVVAPYYYAMDYKLKSVKRAQASLSSGIIVFLIQLYMITEKFDLMYVAFTHIIGSVLFFFLLYNYYNKVERIEKFEGAVKSFCKFEIIKRSIPVAVAAAAHIIYLKTDILMIEKYMAYSDVAVYSISTQILSVLIIGIYPLQVAFFPILQQNYYKDRGAFKLIYLKKSLIIYYMAITWVAIILMISSTILKCCSPSEYAVINGFLFLHAITSIIFYNVIFRSSYLTISGKTKYLLYSQVTALVVNIFLNFILIPQYGLYGASLATTITTYISLILMNFAFKETRWLFKVHMYVLIPLFSRKFL